MADVAREHTNKRIEKNRSIQVKVSTNSPDKKVKIKDLHKKRALEMRALNRRMIKKASFFQKQGLKKYKELAKQLDPDIWILGNLEAIQCYLYTSAKGKIHREKLVNLSLIVRDAIIADNQIFKLEKLDASKRIQKAISLSLLNGNFTKDQFFSFVDGDEELFPDEKNHLKKIVRDLFKTIAFIQFCIILGKLQSSHFFSRTFTKTEKFNQKKKNAILEKIQPLIDKTKIPPFQACVLNLVNKKLNKESVRSSFALWTFEHIIAQQKSPLSSHEIKSFLSDDFPLIIEVAMCIMYYDNQILDNKGGIDDLVKIKKNLISRTILKSWCFEFIERKITNQKKQLFIANVLRKIFLSVDIGQLKDKFWNTLSNFENSELTPEIINKNIFEVLWPANHPYNKLAQERFEEIRKDLDYSDFSAIFAELANEYRGADIALKNYFDRIFLTNSTLFMGIVEVVSGLTNYDGPEKEKLKIMAKGYGLSLQIVNDYADFIPFIKSFRTNVKTIEKTKKDVFKDLLNQTLSLPIILHLIKKKRESLIYRVLKLNYSKLTSIEKYNILKELVEERSLERCVTLSQDLVRAFNKNNKLKKNSKASLYLRDLPSICFFNKYNKERIVLENQIELIEGARYKLKTSSHKLIIFYYNSLLYQVYQNIIWEAPKTIKKIRIGYQIQKNWEKITFFIKKRSSSIIEIFTEPYWGSPEKH